jgi:hypothetical protein
LEQPNVQLTWFFGYEHVPALQVPGAWGTSSVVVSRQVGAGGLLQLTPAHGSPMHMPPAQPLAQAWDAVLYVQFPESQVPTLA